MRCVFGNKNALHFVKIFDKFIVYMLEIESQHTCVYCVDKIFAKTLTV